LEELFGRDLSLVLGDVERAIYDVVDAATQPGVLMQLAVIAAAIVVSFLVGKVIETALEPRIREIKGRRRLLRILALLLRRTSWIVAALLLGVAALVIRANTLPSRSVLVTTAATLVLAWVAISVVSRLIRNRTLARIVAAVAWIYVALRITGAFDEVASGLDSLAVQFGTIRLSLYVVLQAALVIGLLIWGAIIAGNFAERRVTSAGDLTPSLKVLISKLIKIVFLVLATGIALASLGIDLTALTVFSGAVGVGIGFGLQKVVSNYVSGIIILLDKSIKPGDTIAIGETFGWIRTLRARFVSVITRDGREYLIPNEDFITQKVENWSFTDPLIRVDVPFGVSYESDPHAVRKLAVEAAKSVARVEERPQPVCHLTAFGDSSLDFLLRFWITDPQNGMTNVRGAVLLACWDAFKEAGIDIPFPHRQILVDRPIPIRMAGEGEAEPRRDRPGASSVREE
jgi:small-conductance mechanosensitive channel